MINIIKDIDLFEHVNEYEAVLIGTSTYCTMSQGIQLKVMLDYPYVYNKNLETKYGDPEKLGTILQCEHEKEPKFCLCFIYEGNFRPDLKKDYLSYESLEKCLSLVNILYKGKRIATTLLGTSRFDGNGDREKVMEIFEDTGAWNLPVVDEERRYLGFVSKSKIFNSYRQVLVHFSDE